jgi:hypothetical protein
LFWREGVDGQKNQLDFVLGPFLIQPIILFVFILIFLLTDQRWSENAVRGSWAGQICPFLAKTLCTYYNTLSKAVVRANRDQKITKKTFRPS